MPTEAERVQYVGMDPYNHNEPKPEPRFFDALPLDSGPPEFSQPEDTFAPVNKEDPYKGKSKIQFNFYD